MKKIMLTASILVMQAGIALANNPIPGGPTTGGTGSSTGQKAVPEISALEGMAAIAVLAAVMLLVWERRRRAA